MSENINIVIHKGKRWYTRPDDTPVINQGFDIAFPFINGYAIVAINGKYGILKENGAYLLKPQFEFAEACENKTEYMKGIARFQDDGIEYGIGLQKEIKKISQEITADDAELLKKTLQNINSEERNNSKLPTNNSKLMTPNSTLKKPNLSQSLIREIIQVLKNKACAFALYHKYYLKTDFSIQETDTKVDPRKLGIWFEYRSTGALPLNGVPPEPQRIKSGELKAPYRVMEAHVLNWQALANEYRFKVSTYVDINDKKTKPMISMYYKIDLPEIGGVSMRCDWIGEVLNKDTSEIEIADIDIKSSSKGDNKWDADGWERSKLRTKSEIMIQALHTKFMWWEMWKRELPFYFAWFDSKNESNFRFIRVEIPPANIESYPELLLEFRLVLDGWELNGFPPTTLPEICGECPIAASCKNCVKVPQVEIVYFDIAKSDFNQ